MERRKILLGSGAALATALAGCSSNDTSDDDDNSDDTESIDNGDNGDTDDNGETDDTGDTDVDDVPGFDGKKLDLDSDAVTVEKIEHKGDKVAVVAKTDITDHKQLYNELTSLADDHDKATVDHEEFVSKIKTIEWTIDHKDKQVVSFHVDVDWIVDYHENAISKEDFLEKVKQTAE